MSLWTLCQGPGYIVVVPQAAFLLKTLCVMDDLRLCLSQLLRTVPHTLHTHTKHVQDCVLLCGQMSEQADLGPFFNVWRRILSLHGYHFASVAQWRSLSYSTPSSCREFLHLSAEFHLFPLSNCNIEFLELTWKCFFCSLTTCFPSFHWDQRICLGRC